MGGGKDAPGLSHFSLTGVKGLWDPPLFPAFTHSPQVFPLGAAPLPLEAILKPRQAWHMFLRQGTCAGAISLWRRRTPGAQNPVMKAVPEYWGIFSCGRQQY